MTADGVIPAPEDRHAPRYIGGVRHADGWYELVVSGNRIRLTLSSGGLYLDKDERDEFMRLWCEAERQAEEVTMSPSYTRDRIRSGAGTPDP